MKVFRSFHFRLILSSALILLVALFLATTLIFSQYQNEMMQQSREETLRAFSLAETKIDRLLSGAHEAATSIKRSKEADTYLFGSFANDTARVVARRELMHTLSDALAGDHGLNGIMFFRENGGMVGATLPWRFSFEIDSHPFYETLRAASIPTENTVAWLGGYRLSDFTLSKAADDPIMIVGAVRTRYRFSYAEASTTLTMLFSVSEKALAECFDSLNDEGEAVYLLDGAGAQVIGPSSAEMGDTPWFSAAMSEELADGVHLDGTGEKYQVVFHRLATTGWTLVKTIPFEIYAERVERLRGVTWLIGLMVMLVMSGIYTLWAVRFTHPFREMSAALERVQKRDLSVRLTHAYGIYELELMRTEFNSMISSITTLLEQTRAMEHERIELELRNLQSQLNPHMVFNSITAIRWMAMMSGADKVGDMLVELTEIIRPVFTEWRLIWSLRDEVAYIGHYVKLLSLRYGGLIQTDINIDEDVLDICLPCFTLQPLLENCAEHGARAPATLNITVEGRAKDGGVFLRVLDNGRGMAAAKLESLREKLPKGDVRPEKTVIGHSGIGLININRRLSMYGGERCGLNIESEINVGTTISLWIPKKKPEIAQS